MHDDLLFRTGQGTTEQAPWDATLRPLVEQFVR